MLRAQTNRIGNAAIRNGYRIGPLVSADNDGRRSDINCLQSLSRYRKASGLACAGSVPETTTIHYWDADQSLGLAYGRDLELPRGRQLAWDIYFAYAAGVSWEERVPMPDDWVHQLGRDERHLGDGAGLRAAVESLLEAQEPAGSRSLRGLIGR